MSKIVGDEECPKCREVGRDSTGNHLILFEDGGSYCNRCGYRKSRRVRSRSGNNDGGHMEYDKVVKLRPGPSVDRGLSESTLQKYGVLLGYDEVNGGHSHTYYPMYSGSSLVAYKERKLPKGFLVIKDSTEGKDGGYDFFGQNVCPKNNKKLLITGGEEDALAAYQMLKDKYPKFEPSVVSLPTGENTSCIHGNQEFLSNFEEILISTDMDDVGRKVSDDLCKLIGNRCRVLTLEEKDASEMLTKNLAPSFINAFFRAKAYSPVEIVNPVDILDEVLGEVEYGLSYPWDSLTEMTYGLFSKQIISLAGAIGGGKTTFIHQLTSHLVFNLNQSIALYSLEETPVQTMKKLISFVSGVRVDLPGTKVEATDIKDFMDIAEDKILLYDAQGYLEWSSIKGSVRFMAGMGTRFFVIDPLTALTASLSASKANEMLNEMMGDLAQMVQSLDITVFLVSHLNNSAGKAHSEGGRVTMDQFTSSRAVVRWSHLSLGLERDQQAEDEEDKNTMTVRVLKNRVAGTLGTFDLKYSKESGRLHEVELEV